MKSKLGQGSPEGGHSQSISGNLSSSKLYTLALCSGCAHSLESPGLAYSSFLMVQLCQALRALSPSSHPSVHLLKAFSDLCLSQETAGFLRAGPRTCPGHTRSGPPVCSAWMHGDQDTW